MNLQSREVTGALCPTASWHRTRRLGAQHLVSAADTRAGRGARPSIPSDGDRTFLQWELTAQSPLQTTEGSQDLEIFPGTWDWFRSCEPAASSQTWSLIHSLRQSPDLRPDSLRFTCPPHPPPPLWGPGAPEALRFLSLSSPPSEGCHDPGRLWEERDNG